MKKDYSDYKPTKNEIYNLNRSDRENVRLKYFYNYASFSKDDKRIHITVDEGNEYFSMNHLIEEYTGEEITAKNFANDTELPEYIERNKKQRDVFASRFQIDFEGAEYRENQYLWDKDKDFPRLPFNNVLSGARIDLQYGEGILDFIYADFKSAIQEQLKLIEIENLLYKFAQQEGVKKEKSSIHKDEPEKIYSQLQERVEEYYEYSETIIGIKDIIYASLYSAICPPVFKKGGDKKKQTLWYGNYLLRLQQEYREMIEFCFDEDYYPEALANRLPSERFYIYRSLKGLSPFLERTEEVAFSNTMSGKEMPYGMDIEGLKERFSQSSIPNDAHKKLAKKFGTTPEKVVALINLPHFLSRQYVFGSVAEILEMEFTKMLEHNVRFRKCKRCGKYFIMKGNYDTNYCDRIAEGETRNCQDLAAQENYKKKMADNAAIPLYQKYYKRYAARVRVRQIKEPDFKKWKYQAMTKRDECSDGKITLAEFEEWLEGSFPNRKKKQ